MDSSEHILKFLFETAVFSLSMAMRTLFSMFWFAIFVFRVLKCEAVIFDKYTPSVLCLAHEFARNYFFPCERPILSKPILLDSIGQDVHFDVYLECSQKKSWVS